MEISPQLTLTYYISVLHSPMKDQGNATSIWDSIPTGIPPSVPMFLIPHSHGQPGENAMGQESHPVSQCSSSHTPTDNQGRMLWDRNTTQCPNVPHPTLPWTTRGECYGTGIPPSVPMFLIAHSHGQPGRMLWDRNTTQCPNVPHPIHPRTTMGLLYGTPSKNPTSVPMFLPPHTDDQ